MFEHLLTRQAFVYGTLMHTSLVARLWRISAKCALSICLTLGVHSNLMEASTRRCPGGEQVWRDSSVTVCRGVCLTYQRRHKHERE
jgi:hypothetical protein